MTIIVARLERDCCFENYSGGKSTPRWELFRTHRPSISRDNSRGWRTATWSRSCFGSRKETNHLLQWEKDCRSKNGEGNEWCRTRIGKARASCYGCIECNRDTQPQQRGREHAVRTKYDIRTGQFPSAARNPLAPRGASVPLVCIKRNTDFSLAQIQRIFFSCDCV